MRRRLTRSLTHISIPFRRCAVLASRFGCCVIHVVRHPWRIERTVDNWNKTGGENKWREEEEEEDVADETENARDGAHSRLVASGSHREVIHDYNIIFQSFLFLVSNVFPLFLFLSIISSSSCFCYFFTHLFVFYRGWPVNPGKNWRSFPLNDATQKQAASCSLTTFPFRKRERKRRAPSASFLLIKPFLWKEIGIVWVVGSYFSVKKIKNKIITRLYTYYTGYTPMKEHFLLDGSRENLTGDKGDAIGGIYKNNDDTKWNKKKSERTRAEVILRTGGYGRPTSRDRPPSSRK